MEKILVFEAERVSAQNFFYSKGEFTSMRIRYIEFKESYDPEDPFSLGLDPEIEALEADTKNGHTDKLGEQIRQALETNDFDRLNIVYEVLRRNRVQLYNELRDKFAVQLSSVLDQLDDRIPAELARSLPTYSDLGGGDAGVLRSFGFPIFPAAQGSKISEEETCSTVSTYAVADGRVTELTITRLNLTLLPKTIGELTRLTTLNLAFNDLSELPESFATLTSLTHLNLAGNRLTEVPAPIENLGNLQSLILSKNALTELPEWVGTLGGLTKLEVNENFLEILPVSIGDLGNLEQLGAGANYLTSLPKSVGSLNKLTFVGLRGNKLHLFPMILTRLAGLETLDLSSNEIAAVPPEVRRMEKLSKLNLSHNPLPSLPHELSQIRVRDLDLTGVDLNFILPSLIPLIPRLNTLIAGDILREFSGHMKNNRIYRGEILSLNLSSANLLAIPPEIGVLDQFMFLNLSRNELKELPPEIGKMAGLRKLDIRSTSIATFPPELQQIAERVVIMVNGGAFSRFWTDQLARLGGVDRFFKYPALWIQKCRDNDLPDDLDTTHPDLLLHRELLESELPQIDTPAARLLEKVIADRSTIKGFPGDILL